MVKNAQKVLNEDKGFNNPVNDYFSYIQGKRDTNNTSYWVTQLYKSGIKLPEIFILKLTSHEYQVLNRTLDTDYDLMEREECIEVLAEKIISKMDENCFNRNQTLVFKKSFTSKVDLLDEYIFLQQSHDDDLFFEELVSAITRIVNERNGKINELVIQGYYNGDKRPCVQENIRLNTRVRAFYSFESKQVLEMVNCWDSMRLKYDLRMRSKTEEQTILEISKLEQTIPIMNQDIRLHYHYLKALIEDKFKELLFKGVWAVDVLITANGYYIVEMKKEENQ